MIDLKQWAIRYARKGLYVLPMHDKQPMISFADQPAMRPGEVADFWDRYPAANIALRTVQFFVVDIDKHPEANGFESLKKYPHPEYFPDTLTQQTATGGIQLFYMKPKGIEVEQNIGWLKGVDIKAHINNYVLVAPSVRNEHAYKWIQKMPMVQAPDYLLRAIKPERSNNILSRVSNASGYSNKTAQLFEWITNGLGGQGTRNNNLTELVGGMLLRGVEPYTAIELAEQANQRTDPPLKENEFSRTVDSIMKKEERRLESLRRITTSRTIS